MKNAKKSDLFEYLDWVHFVNIWEIEMAIADYFRDYVEKNPDYQPSWWELAYYSELAQEYIKTDDYDFLEEQNSFLDSRSDGDFEDIDNLIFDYLTF